MNENPRLRKYPFYAGMPARIECLIRHLSKKDGFYEYIKKYL